MKKYIAPVIVVLLLALVGFFMSAFTVDQTEVALVQRFGEVKRTIEEPGLYFKMPFADVVVPIDKREIIWNSDNKEVQVADNKQYVVDMVTVVRVIDPLKYRQSVGANIDRARKNIESRLDAALRQTYGNRNFEAALSKERVVMMREIRDQVRQEAMNLGIEVVDVRIKRTDLPENVLDTTYQRMQTERLAEAQDLRSYGEAQATEMQAKADRMRLEKVSEANYQSNNIRGAGDAERNRILAEAANRDPEFFTFYISMKAYVEGLKGNNTSYVISPDSAFFRYFGDTSKGMLNAQPAQAGAALPPGQPAAPLASSSAQ